MEEKEMSEGEKEEEEEEEKEEGERKVIRGKDKERYDEVKKSDSKPQIDSHLKYMSIINEVHNVQSICNYNHNYIYIYIIIIIIYICIIYNVCRLNGKENSFLNTIKGSYLKLELDKEKKEEMKKKIMYLMEVKYCQVCNIYLFIIFTSIYQ